MKKRRRKCDKNSSFNKLNKRLDEYKKGIKDLFDVQYGVFEPGILYHYSPINSIKNIIEQKQIWYTHYKDLGVHAEFKLPYEMSKVVIEDVAKKSRNVDFWNYFMNVFYADNFLERFSVYTLSLSTEKDNRYLWDTFVDPEETGRINGCAIGFDPSYSVTQEISIANNKSGNLLVIMLPINYDKDKFNDYIRKFAFYAEEILNKTLSEDYIKLSSLLSLQFQQELLSSLMSNILSLLPGFIESKHRKEKEMRRFIMEFQVAGNFYPRKIPENLKSVVYGKKRVISDFDLEDIAEIIIGRDVVEDQINIIESIICDKDKILKSSIRHNYDN